MQCFAVHTSAVSIYFAKQNMNAMCLQFAQVMCDKRAAHHEYFHTKYENMNAMFQQFAQVMCDKRAAHHEYFAKQNMNAMFKSIMIILYQ